MREIRASTSGEKDNSRDKRGCGSRLDTWEVWTDLGTNALYRIRDDDDPQGWTSIHYLDDLWCVFRLVAFCWTHGVWMLALVHTGMELKSGSKGSQLERAHERRPRTLETWPAAWRPVLSGAWQLAWSEAWRQAWLEEWPEAWPRAKAVAMDVAVKGRLLVEPWAEVWTRAEAEAGAKAKAKVWRMVLRDEAAQAEASAWVKVEADALSLAGVWAWAQREARAPGESAPAAVASPSTICRMLSDHHRYGVVRSLWHHSPKTRDEYSCLIQFIAPITRLPFELLRQTFLIIINEMSDPPWELILVCKHWHAIVTTIWASLNLGTTTSIDAVAKKLERNQWLLDIVMDTDSDRGHFTPSDGTFKAIFAAIEASSRWRSLVVESFPTQADLPEDLVNHHLQRCSNAAMTRFTTFRIKTACETSALLHGLLRILGTTAGPELTTMQVNSANVISFLAPDYSSIFHSVKVLSLNTPGMPNPVDLLPHLHQLEKFTTSYLSLPMYHNHIDLPFVHTLRHLTLRAVSIQWMSGRTFHVLEDCTLISPLHRHVLHTFTTTLPNCKRLTFQGYPLEILGGVSAHKLGHFSVTCPGTFNGRGDQQLVQLSHHILGENRLAPRILHISLKATNQAWIDALAFMSDLEELVIHNAQPSSLGAKVFQSLVIRGVHASNPGANFTPGELAAPLCPSLRRFGLKYGRWLRPSERFKSIPDFESIIRSRERSNYPLQRFSIWMTSNQKDPLELIEEARMSHKGLGCLAKESRIKKEMPLTFVRRRGPIGG